MNYRERIKLLGIDRRWISEQLGLSYFALARRLNRFTPFAPHEERLLQRLLAAAERRRDGTAGPA